MQELDSEQESRASDSSGARFFSGHIMLALDHFLILSERHLHRVTKDYQEHFTTRAPLGYWTENPVPASGRD